MTVTKKLLEDAIKKAHKSRTALDALAEAERLQYGFTHNERDLDFIIDSVDYGGGGLTFDKYKRIMEGVKE